MKVQFLMNNASLSFMGEIDYDSLADFLSAYNRNRFVSYKDYLGNENFVNLDKIEQLKEVTEREWQAWIAQIEIKKAQVEAETKTQYYKFMK